MPSIGRPPYIAAHLQAPGSVAHHLADCACQARLLKVPGMYQGAAGQIRSAMSGAIC
jgi:hypothetical protein